MNHGGRYCPHYHTWVKGLDEFLLGFSSKGKSSLNISLSFFFFFFIYSYWFRGKVVLMLG